jgi:hypothetical protein
LEGLKGDELIIAEGMLEQALADGGAMTNDKRTLNDDRAKLELGGPIEIKIPEGFAFYGLRLEQYREAARRFAQESGVKGEVVVIGVRSIGTSLSRVVAEELKGARRCTVRPFGDAFRREVKLPEWVDAGAAAYLVVDEGPGMSGSSFLSVARALAELGVGRKRIHFFPGHQNEPGAACSEEMREVWRGIRKWVGVAPKVELDPRLVWSYVGPKLPWPFDCSGEAEGCARRAAEVSCGVSVVEVKDWWVGFEKVDGEPARVSLDELARHVLAVSDKALRREDEVETETRLREMLRVNVEKYFGDEKMSGALESWLEELVIAPSERSSGDGHLEPENWMRAGRGRVWKRKTTGSKLSHHVAYRLPMIWDVAQVIVSWEFSDEDEREFCRKIGDVDRRELGFFKMSYGALELGKAVMFGAEEGVRKLCERRLLRLMREQFVW